MVQKHSRGSWKADELAGLISELRVEATATEYTCKHGPSSMNLHICHVCRRARLACNDMTGMAAAKAQSVKTLARRSPPNPTSSVSASTAREHFVDRASSAAVCEH